MSVFRKLLFPLLIFIIMLLVTCSQSTEPGKPPFKDPRDMTWEVDTLYYPGNGQVMMENILYFSPDDIWLCGWGDVAKGLIWHYDGSEWEHSDIAADIGGMRVDDMSGFSSDDIWAVGYSGEYILLAHYNGERWEKREPIIKGDLHDISSNLNDTLWACGENGMVLKLVDNNWIVDTIDIPHSDGAQDLLKSIEYHNGKAIILASVFTPEIDKYYYIYGNINNWTIADSIVTGTLNYPIKWGTRNLCKSNSGELYSTGQSGLWLYQPDDSWEKLCSVSGAFNQADAVGENYLYAVGDFRKIYFYDGLNWEDLANYITPNDEQYSFTDVWTDGYTTYIIGRNIHDGVVKTSVFQGE